MPRVGTTELNHPRILVLSGTSSSGKTSIARQLQERLPRQYLNVSIDTLLYTLPRSDLNKMIRGERITRAGYDFDQLVRAYHATLKALLEADLFVIADNAWHSSALKRDREDAIGDFSRVYIGVHCELPELEHRERVRGDRAVGTAAWEFERVHESMNYDFEVDTTATSAETCAVSILEFLERQGKGNRV
jgi:chloramphenicol 3-O phosphotransferase